MKEKSNLPRCPVCGCDFLRAVMEDNGQAGAACLHCGIKIGYYDTPELLAQGILRSIEHQRLAGWKNIAIAHPVANGYYDVWDGHDVWQCQFVIGLGWVGGDPSVIKDITHFAPLRKPPEDAK